MKKLLGISLLTALALAATERPAQAWVNSRFSVGLNWSFQSGGNSALWGAWRNGQVPGPWGDGIIQSLCAQGSPPGYQNYGYSYGYPGGHIGAYPHAGGGPATPADSTPASAPSTNQQGQQAWNYQPIPNWQPGQNIYQTVGYQPGASPPANYNYPAYNYAYPGYGYNGYGGYDYYGSGVPSYWYGR